MGELDLLDKLDVGSPARSHGGGRPLANAVHREEGGLLERGRIERAGGVGKMVLAEKNPVLLDFEPIPDKGFYPKLVAQPGDHGLPEGFPGPGVAFEGRHQDPFEFLERSFIKNDIIEVTGGDARLLQAEADGVFGEAIIVLDPGEPLFLRGRDEVPVP